MLKLASAPSICRHPNSVRGLFFGFTLVASTLHGQSFVQRSGTHLVLDNKLFRYSGPNIEWLGLEGYGPHDPFGPRYPTHFEIDDVFATAAEMGAKVIRSQTMGDTIGCPRCIEPEEGQFNQGAFQASDYALSVAARDHMRVIITLIGDCATCSGGGIGQYLAWHKKASFQDFFTDRALITAYEHHIDAVLNHRNAITGVLYRDDPTILAWENCNMCGILSLFTHGNLADVAKWSETTGQYIKSIDHHHLYLDTTGIIRNDPEILNNPSVDLFAFEEYPHWDSLLGVGTQHTTAQTIAHDAAAVVSHNKVFIVNEFGWDKTDWTTSEDLQHLLDSFVNDPDISGDGFWALQAHLDNFGFQPIPADTTDPAFALKGESGEWWALYYPGRKTLVMSAEDMAGRAQQLRSHAYRMSGLPVPEHAVPPSPVISSVVIGGLLAWRGSPGATRYSIESMAPGSSEWKLICDRCATDEQDPWIDPHAVLGTRYRVTAYNADNVASSPSEPK
jgi:mannan endo-1,4-beta-mannosidase